MNVMVWQAIVSVPALVVLPRTTEEVAAAVKICHDRNLPWVARGAGTGLSGGALPSKDCVLIVTARMNRILNQDLDNHLITVQPGVINKLGDAGSKRCGILLCSRSF